VPNSLRTLEYSSLSPLRKHLVDVLRSLQFGRIEGLWLSDGEPQFTPSPRIIQTIKLPVEAAGVDPHGGDFVLKKQVSDLFQYFDGWQNGVISRCEFRFGLPCLVEITVSEPPVTDPRSDWSDR
jgi:hypothetical protein